MEFQTSGEIKKQGLSKAGMAHRMSASKYQLEQLLHPENKEVTGGALLHAARVIEHHLRLELA